ncbi:MAG TPA: tRNA lysidine(34) synthetase TilS [Actinomycetota bacterium]
MTRPPAVARVLERVAKTARAHGMFEPGDTVLACVSGGPDSMCLLYSLWHLRRLFRIRLEVFHFDHRLRPDSSTDAVYVERVAERLKLPYHLRVAEDAPGKGESVEAWAVVRRGTGAHVVRTSAGASVMAEGHTLDDQVETVLLNLFRGSGLEGISGLWPGTRKSGVVQPLIEVERSEVEAFCRALHLRPRRDPTNLDPRHLRNVIRHEVIPAIERATGRNIRAPIARSADLLRADRLELYAAGVEAMHRIVTEEEGETRFDANELASLPRPLASRVVRLALYRVLSLDDVAPWSKKSVDAVLDLAAGRPGRRRDLAHGLKARRERGYVSVSRTSPESRV